MGRRKQRVSKDEGSLPKRSGLSPAWSSSPTRPPRYVLYCTNHESERQYVVNSVGLYAIRKIFDALTEGKDVEPSSLKPDTTMCFGDIDIRSDQMDKILAHVYTPEEEEWELPSPYPTDIMNFLNGARMSKQLEGHEVATNEDGTKRIVARVTKPKIDRSGKVTVQQLAEEIDLDPRDARAALRKAKVEKPEGGWLGDEVWAEHIRVILKKAKKALK